MPRGPSTRQASKKRKTRPEPESEPETEIEIKNSPEPEEPSDSGESKLSPWDPTERKVLDVDSLDLDTSYLQAFPRSNALMCVLRPEKLKSKRQRWTNKKKKAIQKIEDLPEGWHATEPDIDPSDLDAQIYRCHQRIEDNIFPKFFKEKLQDLEASQAFYDRMSEGEPGGLTQEIYERIHALSQIEKDLGKNSKSPQLSNVKAVLKAYRDGSLEWYSDLVTYWSKGTKLCEPRPFDWDEFEALNAIHGQSKSFWTEGLAGPGPLLQGASLIIGPAPRTLAINLYRLAVRAPGHSWWDELEFVHDTGASMMHIFQSDIRRLLGPHLLQARSFLPVVGMHTMQTTAGTAHKDIVELEVTILNQQRNRIVPWTRVQAVVNNEPYVEGYSRRLDGPFVRSMLYTRTIPDGSFNLHLSTIQQKINFDRSIPMESRRVPMPGLKSPTIKKVLFASEPPSNPQLVNKGKTMPGVHRQKA